MSPTTKSTPYRYSHLHTLSRRLLLGLWCVCGCSLQEFDRLDSGSSSATGGKRNFGGSAGATRQAGGNGGSNSVGGEGGTIGTPAVSGAGGDAGSGAGGIGDPGGSAGIAGSVSTGGLGLAGQRSGGAAGGGNPTCGSTVMTVSAAGARTSATGVAVLTVPLSSLGQGTRYNYQNYDGVGSYDLTCATLNVVAYAPRATGGNLHIFFTTTGRVDSAYFDVELSALTNGFQTISIPVPAAVTGAYNPAITFVIRIEVEAGASFGTAWASPETVVYIDSISTSDGKFNDTFTAGTDPLKTSGVRQQAGSALSWLSDIGLMSGAGGATSIGVGGQAGNTTTVWGSGAGAGFGVGTAGSGS